MSDERYISLQEATEYCDYSQEYLSLRARQGKLKSVKFGRNWATKKEWLEEYLGKIEEYNNFKVKEVLPPKNLPVEPSLQGNMFRPRFAAAIVLTIVFLFAGLFLIKENSEIAVDSVYNSSQLAEIEKGGGNIMTNYFSWLGHQFFGAGKKIVQGYKTANDFLEQQIGYVLSRFSSGEKTELVREKESVQPPVSQPIAEEPSSKTAEEGLVVIPSTDQDQENIKKIKESFSDEVKVELKDETSGIITPVFREGDGENYLYIIVPINK